MYKEYFGFRELPFSIAPDPRYLYMSDQHRDALAHLLYGINSDGAFILLTGEVGTGKTTVCRCLLEQMPPDCDIAFILNPKMTTVELLAAVCDEFRIAYPAGNTSLKVFVDAINAFLLDAHARGRRAVLILEEAQNLSPDLLEQIRLLTNLETNQRKLLQIIMLGQPELREMLAREDLRQLSQRITARYHLGPLSLSEVPAYIAHRLAVAGVRGRLFPEPTIKKIFTLSNGIPRLINLICDRALLGTYAQGREDVDLPTLVKASQEVFGADASPRRHRVRMPLMTAPAVLGAGLLIAVLLVLMIYSSRNNGVTGGKPGPISETVSGYGTEKSVPVGGAATKTVLPKQRSPQAGKGENRRPAAGFPWPGGLHENELQQDRLADLKWAWSSFVLSSEPEKKAAR
ncbi:MAG: hypothetical protein C0402_05810 [Thermodesulfovibrio sp.]|nr:hypothetical protein [Thermodesulfovibrio sp.]